MLLHKFFFLNFYFGKAPTKLLSKSETIHDSFAPSKIKGFCGCNEALLHYMPMRKWLLKKHCSKHRLDNYPYNKEQNECNYKKYWNEFYPTFFFTRGNNPKNKRCKDTSYY